MFWTHVAKLIDLGRKQLVLCLQKLMTLQNGTVLLLQFLDDVPTISG